MRKWLFALFVWTIVALVAATAGPVLAAPKGRDQGLPSNREVASRAAPRATSPYSLYHSYASLGPLYADLAARSHGRMTIRQTGVSAGGHPMWQVVITWPMSKRQKQTNALYRATLLSDPGFVLAHDWLRAGTGIRPAIWFNCSIHGDETTGVDAGVLIAKRLALRNDRATEQWLKSFIIVIDPVQNPDGRIADSRLNGNGFDCNRDFLQLSQPETRQTVAGLRTWLPISVLDMHGFESPNLIEPTTIPHNPNLEYDLFIKWALPLAETEKTAVEKKTGLTAQIPYLWGTAQDHLGQANEGWDDYAPYYAAMMAQEYGSIGQTDETPSKTDAGVMVHYQAEIATLGYDLAHKWAIARSQATGFARGDQNVSASVTGRPWTGNMASMLRSADPITGAITDVGYYLTGTATPDPVFPYGNKVGDVTFPFAYIVPVDAADQRNRLEAIKAVSNARFFGVEVMEAKAAFSYDGVSYPAGTFVIMLKQPLRALVNNLFWDGEDVKKQYGVSSMYDVSVWSYPRLWGFDCVKAATAFTASLSKVTASTISARGTITGNGPLFAFSGASDASVMAVNAMTKRGYPVGIVARKMQGFDGIPLGTYVVDATKLPVLAYVRRLAATLGVDFATAPGLDMSQTALLPAFSTPRVGVNVDDETLWVLKNYLGFANAHSASGPNNSSSTPDSAFVSASPSAPAATIAGWLSADDGTVRRTYIGIKGAGSRSGGALAALIPNISVTSDPDPLHGDNGMCAVGWTQSSDFSVAGWPAHDSVFAYPVQWYDTSQVAGDIIADGTYQDGGIGAGVYQSGFWNDAHNTDAAVGKAAMVTYSPAAHGRVVFMGFDPTYRAQPENTFALVARLIFQSAATPPTKP